MRKLTKRGTIAPNMKAKLWSSRILDEIYGDEKKMEGMRINV